MTRLGKLFMLSVMSLSRISAGPAACRRQDTLAFTAPRMSWKTRSRSHSETRCIHPDTETFTSMVLSEPEIDVASMLDSQNFDKTGWESDDTAVAAAKLPVVAVVGRPNVGKSAVVNRLTKKFNRGSIVFNEEGITRDRTYAKADWEGYNFMVVDTGGLVFDEDPDKDVFIEQIREQALVALKEATVVVMVVDGQAGANPLDHQIAQFLRKQKLPVHLAVNKCESHLEGDLLAADFWGLGMGTPHPMSAIHGTGLAELCEELVQDLPMVKNVIDDDVRRICICGRPNAGKSSLLNRLAGEERAIVSDISGTTRDTIDSMVKRNGQQYMFVDTAGIRRKKKVEGHAAEELMVSRALKAMKRCDLTLLVLDASDGVADQDFQLAENIRNFGRACVIVINKWDIMDGKDDKMMRHHAQNLRDRLRPIAWAPQLYISAKTGQRTHKVYEAVDAAIEQHTRRISTAVLNEVLADALHWQGPPTSRAGKQGKIYYCTMVSTGPPTIAIFCNDPDSFNDGYKRYLENQFRKALGLEGTPLRLIFRGKRVRGG